MNPTDKVVLITGASRGLGLAMARELARRGARLGLAARDAGALRTVAGSLAPAQACVLPTDVTQDAQVQAMASALLARFGRIDVLVNNAGLMVGDRSFDDTSPDLWRAVLDTNLYGAFLCARAVLPAMLRQGKGVIVNISSGAAVRTGFLNLPYGVSKAGLDRLTLGLAAEYRDRGIACVSLSPSVSATATVRAMYPDRNVDNWAQPPEMAARALVRLLSGDVMAVSGRVLSARDLLEPRPGATTASPSSPGSGPPAASPPD